MVASIGHYVGNKFVAGKSGRTGDITNPATGEVTAKVAFASVEEVDEAALRTRSRPDAIILGVASLAYVMATSKPIDWVRDDRIDLTGAPPSISGAPTMPQALPAGLGQKLPARAGRC